MPCYAVPTLGFNISHRNRVFKLAKIGKLKPPGPKCTGTATLKIPQTANFQNNPGQIRKLLPDPPLLKQVICGLGLAVTAAVMAGKYTGASVILLTFCPLLLAASLLWTACVGQERSGSVTAQGSLASGSQLSASFSSMDLRSAAPEAQ